MTKQNEIEKIPNKLWGFYIYFLKPFKWMVIISILCNMASVFVDGFVIPYTIKEIISKAISVDKEIVMSYISIALIIYLIFNLLNDTLIVCEEMLSKKFIPAIRSNINVKFLNHIHNHSYKYFSNNFGGSLSNKIADLSGSFTDVYKIVVFNFAPAVMMIIVNSIYFCIINKILGILMIGWMLIHFLYLSLRIRPMRKINKEHSEEISILRGKIVDSLTNFLLVKLNSKQPVEKIQIRKASEREADFNRKAWTESQRTWMPLGYLSGIFGVSLIALMFYLYSKGEIDVSDISYIIMVKGTIFRAVWTFNRSILDFVSKSSKMQQALDTLLVPVEIEDKRGAKNLRVKEGNIELKNVSFHYGNEKNVLDGFNLHIKPGEKVGIVGPSGAGKTTLVNLLLRMFDVQKGKILIDGQNVVDVKQKSLREKISVVTQDSTLFHRTLKENIGYTKEKATEKEIISASKKAGAHDFIKKLPKKYDTLVGERGIKLSGGQRQRVNIARTILKDAPILVLDEATSALDSETEAYIQTTFEKIMQGKTTIAIAHRLSTLKLMDRIIVINHGRIVEEGSHRSLIAKKGTYSKLWSLQSSNFIENEDL